MNEYLNWQGEHTFKIRFYVAGGKGEKVIKKKLDIKTQKGYKLYYCKHLGKTLSWFPKLVAEADKF